MFKYIFSRKFFINFIFCIIITCWVIFWSDLFLNADARHYKFFYNQVIFLKNNYSFFDLIALQRSCLGSIEPVYAHIVYFFSNFCEYETFRLYSELFFYFSMLLFLQKTIKMPFPAIVITIFSYYFFVTSFSAERFMFSVIIYIVIFYVFKLSCLQKNGSYKELVASTFSCLCHVQFGGVAFFKYMSKFEFKFKSYIWLFTSIIIILFLVGNHIEHKIIGYMDSQGSLTFSAIWGGFLLTGIIYLTSNNVVKILALLQLLLGILIGFSRLNLSIWFFLILVCDFNDSKFKLFYYISTLFLSFKLLTILNDVYLYGTPFR